MIVTLLSPPQYDATEVKLFIQSLPPGAKLELRGSDDVIRSLRYIAERMGHSPLTSYSPTDTDHVSYAVSYHWETDSRLRQKWIRLTHQLADEGKLLKKRFPARMHPIKRFVYCVACRTLHPEGFDFATLTHCQVCCADSTYLVEFRARGRIFVELQKQLDYRTLTEAGRKVWPYVESKEAYLYSDGAEWRDCAEERRRAYRKSEAEAYKTQFVL